MDQKWSPGVRSGQKCSFKYPLIQDFLTSFVLKLRPCIPCLQKAKTLSWRQTAETSTALLDCCWQHSNWFNSYLINSFNQLIFRNVVWLMWVLPVASIWKLKVSSADNFLLDFNLPWRFTIFIHPADGQGGICSIAQIFKTPHSKYTNVCYSLSRQTRIVSLSSWVMWITHVCGVSATEDDGGLSSVCSWDTVLLNETELVFTCFCEPGGGRVGVDGTESDHLVEFSAFTDCHTD